MNTKINYLYRDEGNWKYRGSFIVEGAVTLNDLRTFLIDHEWFVPSKVGLKHLLSDSWGTDDHLLHEFVGFEETSDQKCICSTRELIARFARASKTGWFSEAA
jgi:hypothetical protein